MTSSDRSLSKDEWRDRLRTYRRGLSPEAYRARSTLICSYALSHPAVVRAQTIHAYWPLPEQGEVDTRPLIRALQGMSTDIILPVVTSYDPDDPSMEHRRYEGPSSLTKNRWDIPEPTHTERVPPDALDAVLVPALGVDRQGNRIGHGSGYYDAFLTTVDVPRLVLAYEACVVSALPAAPHDIPATAIITESGIYSVPDA